MRVNTVKSIRTANHVYKRFGSWKAAKAAADFQNGKFVVRSGGPDRAVVRASDGATVKTK